MNLYRGAKLSGLKVMNPRIVNHDKPYVYATTDKIEAIIYSVKCGNFNYTNIYGYDDKGNRCLIERKKNCLEEIYNTTEFSDIENVSVSIKDMIDLCMKDDFSIRIFTKDNSENPSAIEIEPHRRFE